MREQGLGRHVPPELDPPEALCPVDGLCSDNALEVALVAKSRKLPTQGIQGDRSCPHVNEQVPPARIELEVRVGWRLHTTEQLPRVADIRTVWIGPIQFWDRGYHLQHRWPEEEL